MKQISILGCGWLGFPLAKHLIKNGVAIKGSTTSENKLAVLKQSGIQPFLISVSENAIDGAFLDFVENSEILIVDIPPKLRGVEKENFVEKIKNLIAFIEKSSVRKVIFISSTSVYADDNSMVTESKLPNPDTESGKQLLEAEKLLQGNSKFKTTIIRFGGLIGEDRHPIRFLSGKENIENPEGTINLIHQEDCIGIITKVIESEFWGEIFNAVTPFHPSRYNYYTQKAEEMMLPKPQFSHEKESIGKTISSEKITGILNYTFRFPTL